VIVILVFIVYVRVGMATSRGGRQAERQRQQREEVRIQLLSEVHIMLSARPCRPLVPVLLLLLITDMFPQTCLSDALMVYQTVALSCLSAIEWLYAYIYIYFYSRSISYLVLDSFSYTC